MMAVSWWSEDLSRSSGIEPHQIYCIVDGFHAIGFTVDQVGY